MRTQFHAASLQCIRTRVFCLGWGGGGGGRTHTSYTKRQVVYEEIKSERVEKSKREKIMEVKVITTACIKNEHN
jgi:hypothetical protein